MTDHKTPAVAATEGKPSTPPRELATGEALTDPQTAFATALAAFQADMPHIGKGQTAKVPTKSGGQYSYSYADLADITEVAIPKLAANGLAWTATPTVTDAGFVLRYALIHVAGHREGGDYPLPDPSRFSSQEIGSALTYARRYALTAVTGIAPGGDDDDGARAEKARAADPLPRQARRRGATTRTSGDQIDPTRPDEWTSPAVTDAEWLAGFESRLDLCGKASEVRGLWGEAGLMHNEGRLTDDDYTRLKERMTTRGQELNAEATA